MCHQSGFQNAVHLLHVFLRQRFGNGVQHPVQTPEMIRRFKNIVDEHSTVHALGFENITGLFMSQPAALYMIGIIGKIHLHFMIDPTVDSMILLEKKRFFQFSFFAHSFLLPNQSFAYITSRSPLPTVTFAASARISLLTPSGNALENTP